MISLFSSRCRKLLSSTIATFNSLLFRLDCSLKMNLRITVLIYFKNIKSSLPVISSLSSSRCRNQIAHSFSLLSLFFSDLIVVEANYGTKGWQTNSVIKVPQQSEHSQTPSYLCYSRCVCKSSCCLKLNLQSLCTYWATLHQLMITFSGKQNINPQLKRKCAQVMNSTTKIALAAHLALVQKMTNCDLRELHEEGP